MKRMRVMVVGVLISMVGMAAFGQELVFSNQTITVEADQLSLESVEFQPLEIVTNETFQWVEAEQIITNGLFSGGTIETNVVQVQQPVTTIETNQAHWVCNVIFELPRGHLWDLNQFPVHVERFKTRINVPVPEALVQSVFADTYPGLQFAATTGNYQPTGPVRTTFLGIAATILAGGPE